MGSCASTKTVTIIKESENKPQKGAEDIEEGKTVIITKESENKTLKDKEEKKTDVEDNLAHSPVASPVTPPPKKEEKQENTEYSCYKITHDVIKNIISTEKCLSESSQYFLRKVGSWVLDEHQKTGAMDNCELTLDLMQRIDGSNIQFKVLAGNRQNKIVLQDNHGEIGVHYQDTTYTANAWSAVDATKNMAKGFISWFGGK